MSSEILDGISDWNGHGAGGGHTAVAVGDCCGDTAGFAQTAPDGSNAFFEQSHSHWVAFDIVTSCHEIGRRTMPQ